VKVAIGREAKMTRAVPGKGRSKQGKSASKRGTKQKKDSKSIRTADLGIKRQYLKSRKVCKVTFRLPRIAASGAKAVCIVGDFNGWSIYADPMKKLKSGDFTITLELEPGREYQFRYLIDEQRWENDWNADRYVKSPYGSDNSVVII
jgi:1,4-alpha-glucan branching enzyme